MAARGLSFVETLMAVVLGSVWQHCIRRHIHTWVTRSVPPGGKVALAQQRAMTICLATQNRWSSDVQSMAWPLKVVPAHLPEIPHALSRASWWHPAAWHDQWCNAKDQPTDALSFLQVTLVHCHGYCHCDICTTKAHANELQIPIVLRCPQEISCSISQLAGPSLLSALLLHVT